MNKYKIKIMSFLALLLVISTTTNIKINGQENLDTITNEIKNIQSENDKILSEYEVIDKQLKDSQKDAQNILKSKQKYTVEGVIGSINNMMPFGNEFKNDLMSKIFIQNERKIEKIKSDKTSLDQRAKQLSENKTALINKTKEILKTSNKVRVGIVNGNISRLIIGGVSISNINKILNYENIIANINKNNSNEEEKTPNNQSQKTEPENQRTEFNKTEEEKTEEIITETEEIVTEIVPEIIPGSEEDCNVFFYIDEKKVCID